MPNFKGGKKHKKGKKRGFGEKRELVYKTEDQEYAQVLRKLGDGRLECNCFDGQKRTCVIRGKMRKRVWINDGDIVLASLREFGDTADIVHKYYPEEAFELQELGEIPDNLAINQGAPDGEEEMGSDDGFGMDDGLDDDGDLEEQKMDDKDIDDL